MASLCSDSVRDRVGSDGAEVEEEVEASVAALENIDSSADKEEEGVDDEENSGS